MNTQSLLKDNDIYSTENLCLVIELRKAAEREVALKDQNEQLRKMLYDIRQETVLGLREGNLFSLQNRARNALKILDFLSDKPKHVVTVQDTTIEHLTKVNDRLLKKLLNQKVILNAFYDSKGKENGNY